MGLCGSCGRAADGFGLAECAGAVRALADLLHPFPQVDGTFTRILAAVQAEKDAAGDIDWLVSVDSTVARAHQHAAGARKKGRGRGRKYVITPSDAPEAD